MKIEYSKYDEARFWSSVDVTKNQGGCWYWRKSTHAFGYGYFRLKRKTFLAHRLALIFFNDGENVIDKQALHSCDNPRCCNPNHIRWGTPDDNVKDAIKRKRKTDPPVHYGEDHPNAKLNWEQVDKIRELKANGETVKELARKFNISINGIYRVINFTVWKPDHRKEVSDE